MFKSIQNRFYFNKTKDFMFQRLISKWGVFRKYFFEDILFFFFFKKKNFSRTYFLEKANPWNFGICHFTLGNSREMET